MFGRGFDSPHLHYFFAFEDTLPILRRGFLFLTNKQIIMPHEREQFHHLLEEAMERRAIAFIEWAEDEGYYRNPTGPRWYIHGVSVGGKTTKELYSVFLEVNKLT